MHYRQGIDIHTEINKIQSLRRLKGGVWVNSSDSNREREKAIREKIKAEGKEKMVMFGGYELLNITRL
jgi:hypothetical protein